MSDAGLVSAISHKKLVSLQAYNLPGISQHGWQQLASLSALKQLKLLWQGAETLRLLEHLSQLPLEEVQPALAAGPIIG